METLRIYLTLILWLIAVGYISSDCAKPKKKFRNGSIIYQRPSDKNLEVFPKNYLLQFACSQGYTLKGAVFIVCLSPKWTKRVPVCTENKCSDPPAVPNALYTFNTEEEDSLRRGSAAIYTCDDTYELENETASTLTCTLDPDQNIPSWTGEMPRCIKKKSCGDPKVSPDGERIGDCFIAGCIMKYTCKEGYDLVGEDTLECLPSGNWTSKRPYCRPLEEYCEHPPPISHGVSVPVETKEGDYYRHYEEVEIKCKPGYIYSGGERFLICQEEGWNKEFADCEETFCGPPGSLGNGTIPEIISPNITEYPYNFEITYICDEGYRLIGDSWRFCDGKEWSGETPHCEVIKCPNPGVPDYGKRIGDSFGVGDKVSFKCFASFQLLGSYERFCQPNGQWSGELASCNTEKNYCPDPGIPINGNKNSSNYDLGERIGFQCSPGFTLWGSKVRECLPDHTWSGREAICKGAYDFDNTAFISEILTSQIAEKAAQQEKELQHYHDMVEKYGKRNLPPSTSINRLILYFVFDVSGSIGEANFRKSVEFAKALVNRVGISRKGARAGAVTFSSEANVVFLPAQYVTTEEVLEALDNLVYTGGGTSASDALQTVREDCISTTYRQLKDKQQTSVVFIMTDGKANMGGNPAKEAEVLKTETGAEIYCIGVTTTVLTDTLNEIASEPKEEHVFILQNFASLAHLVQNIANGSVDYSACGLGLERLKHLSRGRIIGGGRAPEPWPWMAAVYFRSPDSNDPNEAELKCGGSIINEKYILTASHCLFTDGVPKQASNIIVKLGLTDVHNFSYVQKFEVKKFFTHAQYTKDSKIDDYDIALLELSRPIEFNAFVRPICLPPEVLPKNSPLYRGDENAVATGWGYDGIVRKFDLNTDLQPTEHLKEVIMPIQPIERCKQSAIDNKLGHAFTDRMFCAGDGHEGNDTCQGDSGGPLMQALLNAEGHVYWTQIGIVSWGIGCGLADTYGYYTHVHKLRSWVFDTIKEASMAVEEK